MEAGVGGDCILIERREGSAQRSTYLGVDKREMKKRTISQFEFGYSQEIREYMDMEVKLTIKPRLALDLWP